MNTLVKAGVGAALALGAVAAHASIAGGSSSGTLGNAVLFADVYNGSTFVEAYVGDTGNTVANLGAGGALTPFFDANLKSFLTTYATSGTTVYWVVEGGGDQKPAATKMPYLITTAPAQANLGSGLNGNTLNTIGISFDSQIGTINGSLTVSSTSAVTTDNSCLSGTCYAPVGTTNGVQNWFGGTSAVSGISTVGTGGAFSSTVTLFLMSAAGTGATNPATVKNLGTLTLSNVSGLTSAVPIPAALWLLGSGLLGLAGVARRKVGVA